MIFVETRRLSEDAERGGLAMPIDVVTDAKSLYGLVCKDAGPKPSGEGRLLWTREQFSSGPMRRLVWCRAQGQVAGVLTEVGCGVEQIVRCMLNGCHYTKCSSSCNGVLWSAEKGLPPPKRQKDEASRQFCGQWLNASESVAALQQQLNCRACGFSLVGSRV